MKELLLSLWMLSVVASSSAQQEKIREFQMPATLSPKDYLPNRVIFKLKERPEIQNKTRAVQSPVHIQSVSVRGIESKFPQGKSKNRASVLKQVDNSGLDRIYELTFSGSGKIEDVINELLANEAVEYAEPCYVYHTSYLPNDPAHRNNLMGYLNQVRAPQAWDLTRNGPGVILAIVDSGSDLDHPDLAANIYYNTNDPINGIDDDADGFIDNYRGWDFAGASGATLVEDNDPNVKSAAADHGVHVSGIASAVSDNATGVVSVAFNSAKLLIVKVGADNNGSDIPRGYEGIKYAADQGAQIINCSWGGEDRSSFGQDVVNYAINKGCLIVAAAGNSGIDVPQYPAGYEGVLAVANLEQDDERNTGSNYGYYVSLAAPGTSIYSTTFDNQYNYKTGTSMAAPVVASAAALVKSYFPHLTMQQVGEQLRATADNIDAKNPNFINQLGKGRLNVYRALTESPPSIKKQNITFQDKGNGTIPAGDTVSIFVDLKNFLSPVNNLQVNLTSDDPNVTITEGQKIVGFIGTLATQSAVGPFKVYIKPGTPVNSAIEFRLNYAANNSTYTDFEGFVLTVARDFLNLTTSTIATTITSVGKVGFLNPGEDMGTLGFQYKGQQLLYEAALMIGNSRERVSDNARSTARSINEHFVKKVTVQAVNQPDAVEAIAEFDDSNSPDPLNINVKQKSYVFKAPKNDSYLISEYEVINRTNSSLSNIYIGLFTDWDIDGGATNATEYDAATRIAYVYDKQSPEKPYGGIKLLNSAFPAYYPLSNRLSSNILANDDFTTAEKYETLSSGIKAQSLGPNFANGLDVSFVSGYGPFSVPANGSIKLAFAFIGAENLDDFKATATEAQVAYNVLSPEIPEPEIAEVALSSYPNPLTANDIERLVLALPEAGQVNLSLYNLKGQKVKDIKNEGFDKGTHVLVVNTGDLASGVYYYRLEVNGRVKTHKINVLK